MSPPYKMKQANFSEATKERIRRELHVNPDTCSQEEFAWAVKKAKMKYKRELNGTK